MPTPTEVIPDRKGPQRKLLLFTTLSALDGTVATLAAIGALADPLSAIGAGLVVVAGVGAWLSARDAFRGGLHGADWLRLGGVAAISTGLTLAAAAFGAWGAAVLEPVWLPRAAGIATILLGLEVGGLRLRIGGFRLALLVVLAGVGLEVLAPWTP